MHFNDCKKIFTKMNKNWDKKLFKAMVKDQFYDIDTLKDKNVVINTELSGAAYDEYQKNPDDTHRLFYVACTRTENNLFIIEPQRKKAYDI